MCAGLSVGAIWLIFCVSQASLNLVIIPRINIGVIADIQSVQHQPVYTNITCNVTIEWHFVDFNEVFQVFRKIIVVDETRQDVDLIVLLGYRQSMFGVTSLPRTKHKQLLMLNRDDNANNQTTFDHWMRQLSNISLAKPVTQDEPHCRVHANISNIDSSLPRIGQTVMTTPSIILAELVATNSRIPICVLHDSISESSARLFVDEISRRGSAFVIENVDDITNLHGRLLDIYNTIVTSAQKITFVLLCRLDCLMRVLYSANEFDSVNTEYPTLLRQFSNWLAVVYGYNAQVTSLLQKAAHDLDNFAVVPVPHQNPPTAERIPGRLKSFLNKMGISNVSDGTDLKPVLLNKLSKEIVLMEPTSICSHYVVDTLLWTSKGRQFHTIGYADFDGDVALKSDLFPNTHYGYSGRQFKVATEPFNPFVTEIITEKNETKYGGIYIELLNELATVLNFTYTIIRPPDGKWGSVDRTENGTDIFNGMVGMLQRKEVDFAATPMTIIPLRDKVVDFSYTVSHEYTTVLVKKPDSNALKWRTLINPFKVEVLIYIGGALPVVTLFIFVIEKFGPFYTRTDTATHRRRLGGLHHLHGAFWYMYGALLCQGGVRLPDSFAGRTLVSAWWIFCIVIVGTYSGNLIAFLTVSKVVPPFSTIDEMVRLKDQYKWGTEGGTVWETLFKTSTNPTFKKVGDAMLDFSESDQTIFEPSADVHINKVLEGGYAWIADLTTIEFQMAEHCDLTTIKEKVLPMSDAFAFQQNSPHTSLFSKQIMKSHEAGLFEIWKRKWWPLKNFCPDPTKLEAKPITLQDVQSAFYVCLIGLFFGSVACLVEIVIFRCRRNTNNRNTAQVEQVNHS